MLVLLVVSYLVAITCNVVIRMHLYSYRCDFLFHARAISLLQAVLPLRQIFSFLFWCWPCNFSAFLIFYSFSYCCFLLCFSSTASSFLSSFFFFSSAFCLFLPFSSTIAAFVEILWLNLIDGDPTNLTVLVYLFSLLLPSASSASAILGFVRALHV